MSYEAIVCKLTNVRPHPNAKRIKLANASGYQIIVGLDAQEGKIGVFFPTDGQLLPAHCIVNKLYKTDPATGLPMGGYFSANGRVRTQKFRGEASDGFWQELSSLDWTNGTDKLSLGDQFTHLNGHEVCKKYYTPATLRAMNSKPTKGKGNKDNKVDRSMLHQHYSTKQVRHHINAIPKDSVFYITEKCHGTSGRTGRINVERSFSWWQRLISPFVNLIMRTNFTKKSKLIDIEYVSGTRRVVLTPSGQKDGYYENANFRQDIHKQIETIGLHKGEVLFYEIVGFTDTGGAIMGRHPIEDKELKKQYGEQMVYRYGCHEEAKEFKIYVYRIAMINSDGVETNLSHVQLQRRCKELGLDLVPVLAGPLIYEDKEKFLKILEFLSDGPSTLDDSHIREGVVVNIEHEDMNDCLKYKGWTFCDLENIRKNSDDYVDPEEIA